MGDPAYKIYSLKDYLITYESPHFFLCRVRIDVLVVGQFTVFALDLKKSFWKCLFEQNVDSPFQLFPFG